MSILGYWRSVHIGNELVRDLSTVFVPVFAIFVCASFHVSSGSVHQDDEKEDRIEVGHCTVKSG